MYSYLVNFFKGSNISLCDYGCGSGSLSFALARKLNFNKIGLYDVDNEVSKFVKYYIDAQNLHNATFYNVVEDSGEKYDVIMCNDVLEHIEHSSYVLRQIYNKLNPKGYLVLRAAFEVDSLTHLPQAAEDFFLKNNGWKFLNDKFELVYEFDYSSGLLVNGVYRKISEEEI